MLMKSLMFVSVEAARAWNAVAPAASRVSDEAALRLPNVLFGALTVVPLYLLAACFFERRTALLAAAFWAVGVNAITFNRIAKEDTLLVFFVLLATYFYVRAKQTSGFEAARKRRFYILSGASFGLMLASKYFPHYFGLVMLYQHLVTLRQREPGEPRGTTPRVFFVVILCGVPRRQPGHPPAADVGVPARVRGRRVAHAPRLPDGRAAVRQRDVEDAVRRDARLLLSALPRHQGAFGDTRRRGGRPVRRRAPLARAGAGVPAVDDGAVGRALLAGGREVAAVRALA